MKTMKSGYFGEVVLFINVAPFPSPALRCHRQAQTQDYIHRKGGGDVCVWKKTGMFL